MVHEHNPASVRHRPSLLTSTAGTDVLRRAVAAHLARYTG